MTPTPAGPSKNISPAEPDTGNSRGDDSKSLRGKQLVEEALKVVNNPDLAELMILELMGKYSFSLLHLKELLKGELTIHKSLID
jgi:hypothetical protein